MSNHCSRLPNTSVVLLLALVENNEPGAHRNETIFVGSCIRDGSKVWWVIVLPPSFSWPSGVKCMRGLVALVGGQGTSTTGSFEGMLAFLINSTLEDFPGIPIKRWDRAHKCENRPRVPATQWQGDQSRAGALRTGSSGASCLLKLHVSLLLGASPKFPWICRCW